MALRTADDDTELNRSQADYDRKFNDIAKREEEAAAFDDIAKNYDKTASNVQENANIEKARQAETIPAANWKTKNLDQDLSVSQSSKGKRKGRKGPLIAIITALFGAGTAGAGIFGVFSLLPLNIASNAFEKDDAQSTSMTIRTNAIINTKIVKNFTTGSCNVIELWCRYSRPSNRFLKNAAENGIQAVDKDGFPSKSSSGPFPNERPDHYTFTDRKTGERIKIDAKDFTKTLRTNPAFRAAFHNAYNPKVIGYLDSVFEKIKVRFGFRARDDLSDSKDGDDARDKVNENSKGAETGAKAAAAEGADAIDEVAEKLLTEAAEKEVKKVAKAGRGNLFGLVAGVVCGVGDIPGLIVKIVRAYQLAQLVAYSATIIKGIYAWKAGDSSPEAVAAIGDMFTNISGGKSAMDSFGMKNLLFGDTNPADDGYKKYSPGSGVIETLGDISQITSSNEKVQACKVATNPATGAAIDLATSETVVIPVIQFVGGLAASIALENLGPPLIKFFIGLMPEGFFAGVLNFLLGDLTKDLVGESLGNAFISGAAHMMSQTANAGGNMALTIKQKLAYDQVTKQVNIAYAEEDRATLSPFDATNSNTMLGSLVNQLVPYYSKLGTVGGIVSTIGSIVSGSVGRMATVSAAGDIKDPTQYQMCDDPAITSHTGSDEDQTAAGPFCDIKYGIPPEYLDIEPMDIVNELGSLGDIDKNTGEPVDKSNVFTDLNPDHDEKGTESLKGWMDLCTDGTTAHSNDCKITDRKSAMYALYVIDHRIQKTMDGEDKILDGEFPSGTTVGPGGNNSDPSSINVVVNKKHPLNPTNYEPAGLTDVGGGKLMQSEAAAAFAKMKAAAASAGNVLTPISAYRSYNTQVSTYNGYVTSLGKAQADIQSARPGHSEHQTGFAVDINTAEPADHFENQPAGKWLAANAWQYGFILRYPSGKQDVTGYIFEPWHYRYIGTKDAKDMHDKGVLTLEDYYNIPGGDYAYIRPPDKIAALTKRYSLI